MTDWIRNDWATAEMRRDPFCPPDACVYDKGPLRAFVLYADMEEIMPGPRWHIVLASADRKPGLEEAREAQEALLPGLRIVVFQAPHAGDLAIHICEVLEPERRRWLQ